ncbi:hypothetical protein ACIQ6V_18205 [Streptomyces sp. NPDC096198]|uniref:hypothetical protein n=1 Tax=Streptomyces sp. NPDC096198 TaxID=3366080 RepID=UPI0038296D62
MSVKFLAGPPPARQTNTRHALLVAQLRAHPNQWAEIQEKATGARAAAAAQAIRSAQLASYAPAGSFQAIARTVVENDVARHVVYARYVGTEA